MSKVNLNGTIDAFIWTKEWLKIIKKNPHIPTDFDTMLGWFANALMAGYDAGIMAGESMVVDKSKCHGGNDASTEL